ncbi:MAG TPA: fibronectin type III domain-containing protein [Saprospiraceae bacterium]|nr:fibronectin type III domain-containing protein [Saprospiraceae bacterium]HMP22546.1 fibronectin type III domain-containing protein [Saprospiraceae bacterium]
MRLYISTLYLLACCWLLASTGALAQAPVAHYPFAGNASDLSGNNNTAVINGAVLTQDRFGWANSAFQFDGTQAFLQAPNLAALNSDFTTVSFWVRVNALPGQGEAFLMSFGGWQERWKISLPNHGKPVWTTNNTSGISDMDSGDGNVLVPGTWMHVAFVHDGTNDRIYMNGVRVATKAVAGALNNTTRPLGIGYNPIDNANFFNGDLDEVMIFAEALSDQQIADLYAEQSAAPNVAEGLVAAYAFSGNALDGTPFGNHGTATEVTPATDRFGFGFSAYDFNGTSSKIEASNSAQLNSPYTTVSFWVRPNALPATGEAFLMSFGGWQERWKISLPGHGKPVWTTNNTSGISDMDSGDGNSLQPGVWTHVVFVHDGTNDKIFMDGALVASKAVAGAMNSTTRPLGMGYNPIDGGNYFDGALDEVQLFNYALSDEAIADLYAAQAASPAEPTDLVAEYNFAGDAQDATQFGNHALVNEAVPTVNRFGYANNAYRFSGAEAMWAANSPALNSDFATISFWVRVQELPASGEVFLLSNGGWQQRWKISLPGHGKPVFTTNYANGISDMDSGDGNALQPGVWAHVAMVHDGATNKIFINGALANEKAVIGALNATRYPLGIGYNPIDNDNFFNGDLDDIQIYNRALSNEEIADLYAAQSQTPAFADELVAFYPFNGNANDVTPFRNHARVSGAQLDDDRFGKANKAYNFNGLSDEITAANSPQLNSDFTTVSFWVNVNELPGTGEAFLLSFGGWQERWKISLPPHGKPVWTTNNTSGISDMDSGDANTLQPGVWTHVVMVHDGTNDRIFFNGAPVASKAVSGTLNSTTRPLGMGYNPIDGGSHFNGALDEVQIYNRALNDQEIADLYAAQSQPPAETDTEAPSAPLNLTAIVNFNNVTLNWLPSTDNVGVTGYNVFQNNAKIATTIQTSLALLELPPLTEFTFGVTAVDAAGNESVRTTLQVTTGEEQTPDTTPPTMPGNLTADAGSNSVLLSWEPSVDDRRLAGYVVLVDGILFDTLPPASTSVFISGLEPQTLYTFEVYAFDAAGNNSDFAEITIATEPEIDTGEPGLVAWYPFEGNANDATPYANHGAIGGNPVFEPVTNRPNASGTAIKFDGQQDSVLAANAVQLISDFATVSFWIRVDGRNFADAEAYILSFGHWSQRWKVSLPQHLKIVWTTNSKTTQFPNFISDMDSGDGNELTEGFWWYVTMVHDGVNDIIYIDGQEVNRKPAPGTLNSTNRPLGMGNNPIEGGQYFIGALDELKIYNKALTAAEIANLYGSGTTSLDDYLSSELRQVLKVVYPNPTTDRLVIEHTLPNNQPLLLRVFDINGRQLEAIRFNRHELPEAQLTLDVSRYPEGSYFLNFVFGGKNLGAVKFIKKQ